jgi:hypothetical protein
MRATGPRSNGTSIATSISPIGSISITRIGRKNNSPPTINSRPIPSRSHRSFGLRKKCKGRDKKPGHNASTRSSCSFKSGACGRMRREREAGVEVPASVSVLLNSHARCWTPFRLSARTFGYRLRVNSAPGRQNRPSRVTSVPPIDHPQLTAGNRT